MRGSKSHLAGTGRVYRFTLAQMLKGKTNLLLMAVFVVLALASVPLLALLWGRDAAETSDIARAGIWNETGYEIRLADIPIKNTVFANTTFVSLTEEMGAKEIGPSDVYIHMGKDSGQTALELTAVTAQDTVLPEHQVYALTDALTQLLNEARYRELNAAPEQMEMLTANYSVQTRSVGEYLEEKEDDVDNRFGAQLCYSILVLMLCTFVTSFIVQKVIEEKASRLTELLMVSVQPLALLLGKILAVMTYVFGLLVMTLALLAVSYAVTGQFMDVSAVAERISALGAAGEAFRVEPLTLAVMLFSLLLSYFTVSLYGGLLAAGCSGMEDVEPVNLTVVLTVMFGYLASIIAVGADHPILTAAVSLFPIISGFSAPVNYFVGKIGLGMLLLSWALQILVIAALACACAGVYRDLMLYRGERIKIGRLFSMLKGGRAAQGGAEE